MSSITENGFHATQVSMPLCEALKYKTLRLWRPASMVLKVHKPAKETYLWTARLATTSINAMIAAHGWDIAGATHYWTSNWLYPRGTNIL
jgi:hypothetical protein